MKMDDLVLKALTTSRESRSVEFKELFDTNSPRDWCEVLKDIIAIANTDGGVILVGVNNKGQATGSEVSSVLTLDHADLVNKIHKYTNVHFSEIEISEESKDGYKVAAIRIQRAPIPIVFTRPGTYDIGGGKQGRAFSEGVIYFRHGAKSEPGTTEDLRRSIEKQLEAVRRHWINGVRKVVTAPRGAEVLVRSKEVKESSSPTATPIRLVNDPTAPAYRKLDPNLTHPHRLKEVVQTLNKELGGKMTLRSYDLLCIRRLHGLDDDPNLCYRPKFGSLQYSDAFIEWVKRRYKQDPAFFEKSRKECSDRKYELKLSGVNKRKG